MGVGLEGQGGREVESTGSVGVGLVGQGGLRVEGE